MIFQGLFFPQIYLQHADKPDNESLKMRANQTFTVHYRRVAQWTCAKETRGPWVQISMCNQMVTSEIRE